MCLNLRAAVADASIIAKYGKEASRVTARVSKVMESVIKNGLKFKGQDLDDNGQDNWIGDEKEQLDRMLFHKNRPPAFTVGMCTALDYCIDKATANPMKAISTGSIELDKLLSSLIKKTKIFHSSVIPSELSFSSGNEKNILENQVDKEQPFSKKRKLEVNVDQSACFGVESSDENSDSYGIPFGFITEIFGASASGKTQVSLTAACVAILNNITVHYIIGNGNTRTSVVRRVLKVCLIHAKKLNPNVSY